jgi:4,5-dihydroxyphthalate decarboxylase
VVIRRELYEKHPWLALNLYHAFVAAKKDVERETAETLRSYFETGLMDGSGQNALTEDPKAYGLKASRKVIETISQYLHEQGLTNRSVAIDEIFAASALDI